MDQGSIMGMSHKPAGEGPARVGPGKWGRINGYGQHHHRSVYVKGHHHVWNGEGETSPPSSRPSPNPVEWESMAYRSLLMLSLWLEGDWVCLPWVPVLRSVCRVRSIRCCREAEDYPLPQGSQGKEPPRQRTKSV